MDQEKSKIYSTIIMTNMQPL